MRLRFLAVCAMAACLALTAAVVPAHAKPQAAHAATTDEAERIYQDYGDAIYQVQVIDRASDKKTVIGSGFQFNAQGLIATNYHVVAEAVRHPATNRLEYLHDTDNKQPGDDNKGSLKILLVDVVHDLAILKMDHPGKKWVELGSSHLPKGTKLFSLGNPHDIGFTIIEGTYNGLTPDSFFDHIHFSGSLNPGMSGGPALGHDGRVVGINVSTAGNQISFLVPVEPLRQLLLTYLKKPAGYDFLSNSAVDIQDQLLASQEKNVARTLASKWESKPFNSFMVPGRIAPAFKCWGGTDLSDKTRYVSNDLTCMTQDQLFLNESFTTGGFLYRYDAITPADKLSETRFYNYYNSQYALPLDSYTNAGIGDVTNFECNNSFVTMATQKWKASFCVRQYKRYPKLYDMHVYMALVGWPRKAVMVSLIAQGVSKDNALKLSSRFMSEIKRLKPIAPPAMASEFNPALLVPPPRAKASSTPANEPTPPRAPSGAALPDTSAR